MLSPYSHTCLLHLLTAVARGRPPARPASVRQLPPALAPLKEIGGLAEVLCELDRRASSLRPRRRMGLEGVVSKIW